MNVSAMENPIPRFPPVMRTVRAVVMSPSVTVRRNIASVDRETQSLTSLPASPAEERASRMVSYLISMGLRLVCLFLCLVVPGWWVLIPAVGVIVLPVIAMMLANVIHADGTSKTRSHSGNVPSLTSGRL